MGGEPLVCYERGLSTRLLICLSDGADESDGADGADESDGKDVADRLYPLVYLFTRLLVYYINNKIKKRCAWEKFQKVNKKILT